MLWITSPWLWPRTAVWQPSKRWLRSRADRLRKAIPSSGSIVTSLAHMVSIPSCVVGVVGVVMFWCCGCCGCCGGSCRQLLNFGFPPMQRGVSRLSCCEAFKQHRRQIGTMYHHSFFFFLSFFLCVREEVVVDRLVRLVESFLSFCTKDRREVSRSFDCCCGGGCF